jgi:general secretion pathway protein D
MVFIRPTVVRNQDEARAATSRSYRYIRAEELWDGADSETNSLDAFVSEVLGSAPPK